MSGYSYLIGSGSAVSHSGLRGRAAPWRGRGRVKKSVLPPNEHLTLSVSRFRFVVAHVTGF